MDRACAPDLSVIVLIMYTPLRLTMLLKSAPPTPTITMERGSLEAATILSVVRAMSEITPSYSEVDR